MDMQYDASLTLLLDAEAHTLTCLLCSEALGVHQQVHPEEQGAALPEPQLGRLQELHHVRCAPLRPIS